MHPPVGQYHRQGFAALEYIITAPILLLLLLATADIGHLLYQYNTLNKLAQQGARYFSRHAWLGNSRLPDTLAAAETALMVQEAMNASGVIPSGAATSIQADIVDTVFARVQISYDYEFSNGFMNIQQYFGAVPVSPLQVQACAVIRILQ